MICNFFNTTSQQQVRDIASNKFKIKLIDRFKFRAVLPIFKHNSVINRFLKGVYVTKILVKRHLFKLSGINFHSYI